MSADLRDQLQTTLGDAYTLERELGGGGMSRVFVAQERRFNRQVVVKVLTPDLAAGVSATRFEREIQLVAALQQANIVPLLNAGETNGLPYYTMPFVDGLSLRARLARSGAMPVPEVVSVLRDVTRALAYAHERGVVHRDIKPENILLSGDAAVVTDFGIAKALSAAKTDAPGGTLTQIGTSLGTPAYMSPEQASGDPDTDHRTDFYALGCVAYEMLLGEPPFAGRPVHQLFAAHISEPPPPVGAKRTDCPPALAALVMRCLEKDPARRPQSAREILQALDTVATPTGAFAGASGARRWFIPAVVAAALVLLALGIVLARRSAARGPKSVAVLPFTNVGGDSTQEYFSDGIADEVSSALAQVPGIRVAARSSANAFKGKQADAKEIGAKLHVGAVLEGTVRHAGRQVSVTTDLVSASDGLSIWSQTYKHDASDAPALQRQITSDVVRALHAGESTAGGMSAHVPDPAAYDLYLRGRYFSARGAREDLEKALDLYRQAIEKDPAFAGPHAATSFVYSQLADAYLPPDQAYPMGRAEAERAIALDSTSAEAHSNLAAVLVQYDWDWERGKREIDRALALNPSDPTANLDLAMYHLIFSDTVAAQKAVRQYVRVDPLSPFAHLFGSVMYFFAGLPDSTISEYRQSQEIQPGYLYIEPFVDEAYRARRMLPQALTVNEDASKKLGRPTTGLVLTLLEMGKRAQAERAFQEIEAGVAKGSYVPPELLARCAFALGQRDKGFMYLKKGVEAHSAFAPVARYYPEIKAVTGDPRYAEIRQRLHLK